MPDAVRGISSSIEMVGQTIRVGIDPHAQEAVFFFAGSTKPMEEGVLHDYYMLLVTLVFGSNIGTGACAAERTPTAASHH